jgi:hypothetical protein
MADKCPTCATPLDAAGRCVTCAAREEGLRILTRAPYAQARELQVLLEGQGIAAEIEQVPASRPHEKQQPSWNLYAPEAGWEAAEAFLKRDWASLLGDPDARAAAERGDAVVDLDAGGEIACPACGHRFAASAAEPDCPECGLSLGVGETAPAEGEGGA